MGCCKQLLIFSILVFVADMVLGGEWSTCSRTCGVGIMHRTIPCQNGNCDGTRKEFRACNVKRCPNGNADYRSEQCGELGEKLMSFTNESDPCKLLCSSPGENPVMKGLVVDGTPCPSSGVCVDGQCVPFGCDGVLGSKKTINKCGTCSDLCVQLPCTFKKITSNDYHTTIPYESTNIAVALGSSSCSLKAISSDSTKSQRFRAQSDISIPGTLFMVSDNELTAEGPLQSPVTIEVKCPRTSHKIHCNYHMSVHIPYVLGISNLYEWAVGENYTPCSQTCGIGIHMLEIYCQIKGTDIKVSTSKCDHLTKRGLNVNTRFCYQQQCPPEWIQSDWTPCSESCQGGYRERNVSCMRVIRNGIKPVLATGCSNEAKLASWQECNNHPCHNHWHTTDWSKCSVDCGEGIQSRHVTCRDASGNEIRRYNCKTLMPHSERSCTGDMCVHKWIKSHWTNCSVSCGEGVQTRHVNCTENGTVVDDSACLENIPNYKRPKENSTCQGACCNGVWAVSNWFDCVAPICNKAGIQHRNVYCIRGGSTSEEYDYIKCDPTTEPLYTKECYVTEGCSPDWVITSNWTQCSATCEGVQTRTIACKLGKKILADEKCSKDRPTVSKKCGPSCNYSKICKEEFCSKDDLPPCQKWCCDDCDERIPPFILPELRHSLCDKPCCYGAGGVYRDRDHCRDDLT